MIHSKLGSANFKCVYEKVIRYDDITYEMWLLNRVNSA